MMPEDAPNGAGYCQAQGLAPGGGLVRLEQGYGCETRKGKPIKPAVSAWRGSQEATAEGLRR